MKEQTVFISTNMHSNYSFYVNISNESAVDINFLMIKKVTPIQRCWKSDASKMKLHLNIEYERAQDRWNYALEKMA